MVAKEFLAIGEGLLVGPFLFVTFSLGKQRKSNFNSTKLDKSTS